MRRESRLRRVLTARSGASLMFVLAAMLLLLSLGVSAIAAAAANAGSNVNTRIMSQMDIHADSLNQAVLQSLRASGAEAGLFVGESAAFQSLGGQILDVLNYPDSESAETQQRLINLLQASTETELSSGVFSTISLSLDMFVNVSPKTCRVDKVSHWLYDIDGNPVMEVIDVYPVAWLPKSAHINGTATLTFTVTVGGKSAVHVTTFRLQGADLQEPDVTPEDYKKDPTARLQITNAGTWEVESYEKADR